MTKIKVKTIIWEEWNIKHIKKHNIVPSEVTEVGSSLIYHQKTRKERYIAIGRSGTRLITLILSRKDTGTYYLVTARDSNKKERRRVYDKEKQKNI